MNLFATSTDVLENEKETLFINFQKNNKPAGMTYIKEHSVDYFFDAIREDVESASNDVVIVVKSIEAEVIDVEHKGTTKVASVHYQAAISTNGIIENIDEVWHFVYSGWNWKLAGIEQV